jgi:DNA-binding beta-propeller fold protein YncE
LDGAVDPVVSPDGKNVYVHRRKTDNAAILCYDRNQDTGILSNVRQLPMDGGTSSITKKISPDGKNLYTQGGNNADALVAWVRLYFIVGKKNNSADSGD